MGTCFAPSYAKFALGDTWKRNLMGRYIKHLTKNTKNKLLKIGNASLMTSSFSGTNQKIKIYLTAY